MEDTLRQELLQATLSSIMKEVPTKSKLDGLNILEQKIDRLAANGPVHYQGEPAVPSGPLNRVPHGMT